MKKKLLTLCLLLALLVSVLRVQTASAEGTQIDYSDALNWYKIPDTTKDVDTFFIYPTLYAAANEGDPDYAAIDDPEMTAGVGETYQMQASAFEDSTNLFIPYYRQASMKAEIASYIQTGSIDPALTSTPLKDITAALDFYFENCNGGRPFIIAGHSQGAAIAKLVLKAYFRRHPEYYKRMVAAYIIGYSVTREDLDENPHLKFASGETDTGVIVSWNTEGQYNVDTDADNIVVLNGSIAINPLNWELDDTYAPASMNMGSLVMDEETGECGIKDIGADAQVNVKRGVVVTNADAEPVTDLTEYFGPQSFHTGDYSFYYMNIRDNAAKRIAAYKLSK
ncbi:MAG: DUF3089 domain-containing protein [Synergistes sp.]|nr:DUF3089 domain-containing protein [Synergistes sp.]